MKNKRGLFFGIAILLVGIFGLYSSDSSAYSEMPMALYTKTKVQFLNDESVMKAVFLAVQHAEKTRDIKPFHAGTDPWNAQLVSWQRWK